MTVLYNWNVWKWMATTEMLLIALILTFTVAFLWWTLFCLEAQGTRTQVSVPHETESFTAVMVPKGFTWTRVLSARVQLWVAVLFTMGSLPSFYFFPHSSESFI